MKIQAKMRSTTMAGKPMTSQEVKLMDDDEYNLDKRTNFKISFHEASTEDFKSGKSTHTSNCPFKTMLGPHPMSVPVPPMLDA